MKGDVTRAIPKLVLDQGPQALRLEKQKSSSRELSRDRRGADPVVPNASRSTVFETELS